MMVNQKTKRRLRRKRRVRKKIYGTPDRPRLTIFRSLKHIYAQIIDDTTGTTMAEASTLSKELEGSGVYGGNMSAAAQVGKLLGERALAKDLKQVAFDRNGYKYHGRVKALAESARKVGLKM